MILFINQANARNSQSNLTVATASAAALTYAPHVNHIEAFSASESSSTSLSRIHNINMNTMVTENSSDSVNLMLLLFRNLNISTTSGSSLLRQATHLLAFALTEASVSSLVKNSKRFSAFTLTASSVTTSKIVAKHVRSLSTNTASNVTFSTSGALGASQSYSSSSIASLTIVKHRLRALALSESSAATLKRGQALSKTLALTQATTTSLFHTVPYHATYTVASSASTSTLVNNLTRGRTIGQVSTSLSSVHLSVRKPLLVHAASAPSYSFIDTFPNHVNTDSNLSVIGTSAATVTLQFTSGAFNPPNLTLPGIPSRTIMLMAVVPGLGQALYATPYSVEDTISAYSIFGPGPLIRAIGEVFRQGAVRVFATVVAQESDIPAVFNSLVDVPFDILVPVGLTGTAARYATFGPLAYQREQNGSPIIIIMSADLTSGTSAATLASNPPAKSAGSILNPGMPNPLLFSRYFLTTTDQLIINPNTPSQYQTTAASSVAGLISRTLPYVNLTNAILTGVKLAGGYNTADALLLANNGFVTLRNSTRRGVTLNYGVSSTSTTVGSPIYSPSFHNISTLRICQYVIASLRDSTTDLIGQPSSSAIKNIVQQTIQSLAQEGALTDATYTVDINQVAGSAYITFALAVPSETEKISLNARLSYIRS